MKFFSCLISFFFLFNSIFMYFPAAASAASTDVRIAEQNAELGQLRKEKASLEKRYFQATLEKTKLENSLLDYKDKYFEVESSLSSRIAIEKAPLKQKIKRLEIDLDDSQNQLLKIVNESGKLRRELESRENSLAELQNENLITRTELSKASIERDEIAKEMKLKAKDLSEVLRQKDKLADEIDEIEKKLDQSRKEKLKQVVKAKVPLENEIKSLKENLRNKASKLEIVSNQLKTTTKELEERTKKVAGLTASSERAELKANKLAKRLKNKKAELDMLSSEKNQAEKQYYMAQRDKAEVEKMLAKIKNDYEELETSLTENITIESKPLKQKIDRLTNQRGVYDREIKRAGQKVEDLKKQLSTKENTIEELQYELRTGLSENFKVQKRYESRETDSNTLAKKIVSLTEVLNKAVSDVAAKGIIIEEQKKELVEAKAKYAKLRLELGVEIKAKDGLSDKLRLKNKELLSGQNRQQKITDKLSDLKIEHAKLRKKLSTKQSKLRDPLKQKVAFLELALKDKEVLVQSLTQRLDDTAQELGAKMDRTMRLSITTAEAEDRLEEVQNKLSKARKENDTLQEQKKQLEKKFYSLESEKTSLDNKLAKVKGEYASFKAKVFGEHQAEIDALQQRIDFLAKAKEDNFSKIGRLQRDLGMASENVSVREGLLEESDKTLKQNEMTITSIKEGIKQRDIENKNLMEKVISLNEELNGTQKDLSLKKADVARYRERIYFLEQELGRLNKTLEKESAERGTLNVELSDKEKSLSTAKESEAALTKELESLEHKIITMKTSLSQQVAMAKAPLQTKILEFAALVRDGDSEVSIAEEKIAILQQKIEEKTRSILRLKRKIYPYGEALGQSKSEVEQRSKDLAFLSDEKISVEEQIAGVRADYKNVQEELDEAKKEIIKKGLVYRRRVDPIFEVVEPIVKKSAGRLIESAQEKVKALSIKANHRAGDLAGLTERYKELVKSYNEKKTTLERLKDENVLYGDALSQTKAEVINLEGLIKRLTTEKIELKEKLIGLKKTATVRKDELSQLKIEHVEVESALLDQVVQTRNLLNSKVHALTKQLTERHKQIIASTSEAEILKKHLQEKEIQITSLNNKVLLGEESVEQLQQQVKQKESFSSGIEERYSEMKRAYASLEEKLNISNIEKEGLNNKVEVLKAEHGKFSSVIIQSTGEKEYLTRELIKKSDKLVILEDSQIKYIAEIEDLRNKLDDTRTSINDQIQRSAAQYKTKIEVLEDEVKERNEAGADLSIKLAEIENALGNKNKELSHSAIDVNECSLRLNQNRATLKARSDELDTLRNQKNTLEKELFKERLDGDGIITEMENLRTDNAKLKEKLDKKLVRVREEFRRGESGLRAESSKLEEKLLIIEQEKAELVIDLRETAKTITGLRNKLEVNSYKMVQAKETADSLGEENRQLQTVVASLNKELQYEQENSEMLRKELANAVDKNAELVNEQAQLSDLLRRGVGDKDQLANDLIGKSRAQAKYEEKYKQATKELVTIRTQLEKVRGRTDKKVKKVQNEFQRKIANLTEKLEDKKIILSKLTSRISSSNTNIDKTADELYDLRIKLDKQEALLSDLRFEILSKNKHIEILSAKVADYERNASDVLKENLKIKKELIVLDKKNALLKENLKGKINKAKLPLEREITSLNDELKELQIVYKDLKNKTPQIRQSVDQKDRKLANCDDSLKKNLEQQERLEQKIVKLTEKFESEKAELRVSSTKGQLKYREEIKELKSKLKRKGTTGSSLEKEVTYLELQIKSKDEKIAKLGKVNSEAKEENAKLKEGMTKVKKTNSRFQKQCDQEVSGVKKTLENQIVDLKTKLIEKDATIRLLSNHIEENKTIVDSLKKEMGLYSQKNFKNDTVFTQAQQELRAVKKELESSIEEGRGLSFRNAELLEMIKAGTGKTENSEKTVRRQQRVIDSREAEIQALQADQKELTDFLRKEIQARKSSIKELTEKTNDLNASKEQYKKLINKIKLMQEGMIAN